MSLRPPDPHRLEARPDDRSLSFSKWVAYLIVGGIVVAAVGSCAFWMWYPRQAGKVVVAMMPYLQNCETEACQQRVMDAHRTCRSQTKVPKKPTPNRRTPYDYCMQRELRTQ